MELPCDVCDVFVRERTLSTGLVNSPSPSLAQTVASRGFEIVTENASPSILASSSEHCYY